MDPNNFMAFWYALVLPHYVAGNFGIPFLPDDLSVLFVDQFDSEDVLGVAYKKPNLADLPIDVDVNRVQLSVARSL